MTVPDTLTIALAQLDPVAGDVPGNVMKARLARNEAARRGADLVLFSELFLSGYPPEDLARKPAFQDACREACEALARETSDEGPAMLIGLPWVEEGAVYNAVALLDRGRIAAVRFKVDLARDVLFDETRVFIPGPLPGPIVARGVRVGVPIGSDIAGQDPVECLVETGGEILLVPSASPYRRGGSAERLNAVVARVTESGLPLAYLNQVGGQDEAVFDGASFVLDADAALAGQLPAFRESVALTRWRREVEGWTCEAGPKALVEEGVEADYAACVLGLRDFVDKRGVPGIVLGAASGVEAALAAAIALDALGPDRVRAGRLALPAEDGAGAWVEALGWRRDDPAASPARGWELLSACSRSTLLVGGLSEGRGGIGSYNPLKDLYRTEIRRLLRLRDRWKPSWALGPDGPIAEYAGLAPGSGEAEVAQQRSLPPDEVLDAILKGLVDRDMRISELLAEGHDSETVKRIERLVYASEAQRRASAPGPKLSSDSLRRYPIANRFHDSGAGPYRPDRNLAGAAGNQRSEVMDV